MKKILLHILFVLLLFTACSKDEYPIPDAKKYFLEGNELYKQEKFKAAIKKYNRSLRYDDSYAMVYLKRGDCYRKLRKASKAIRDYTRVIRLRPSNARAWHHRGTLKIKIGKKRDGCEDVKKAKELCYVPAEKYYRETCL